MNRPLIVALILAFSPVAAMAQVTEDPAVKQIRIDQYQDRRLILDEGKGEKRPKGTPAPGETPTPLVLRQGPDQIYQVDFVQLMNDPSLSAYWGRERNKDWAIWLGSGAVGIPTGAVLFLQNFTGEGPLAPFGAAGRPQAANAGDLRAYALSVAGAGLALYGAYSLGLWITENLDLYHPERLDRAAIDPRVRVWNEALRERLNLDPQDIPSEAPTPRPSPSPSRTPNPDEEEDMLLLPSPLNQNPDSGPYGNSPPPTMGTPMPLADPGAIPSELMPTPVVRPSVFKVYPGGYPVPDLRPNFSPSPSVASPAP